MILAFILALATAQSASTATGQVTAPRRIYSPMVSQHYPPVSLARGEQGLTELACTLGENGRLTNCSIRRSSGFPLLDGAAFQIAEEMLFSPKLVDGVAVEARVILPVQWLLGD